MSKQPDKKRTYRPHKRVKRHRTKYHIIEPMSLFRAHPIPMPLKQHIKIGPAFREKEYDFSESVFLMLWSPNNIDFLSSIPDATLEE